MNELVLIDDIVKVLYAIRAGLSSVYVRNTKITQNNELIKREKQNLTSTQFARDNYPKVVAGREEKRLEEELPFSPFYHSSVKTIGWVAMMKWVIRLIFLAAGAYLTYIYYKDDIYVVVVDYFNHNFGFIGMLLALVSYVGGVVTFGLPALIGYLISSALFGDNANTNVFFRRKKKSDTKIVLRRNALFTQAMESPAILGEIQQFQKIQNEKMARSSEIIHEKSEENRKLTEEIKGIHIGMIQAFSSNIKPVDWPYVDLLVYYFETGRTTTLKDALLLLEQQIMTNQIVKALNLGTQYMSDCILKVGAVINKRLGSIENQMDSMQSEMSVLRSGIRHACSEISSLKDQNESLFKDLITAQYVSSQELAKSLDHMEVTARIVN